MGLRGVWEVRTHIDPGKLSAATPTVFHPRPGEASRLSFGFLPEAFDVSENAKPRNEMDGDSHF
jgi:hypothetical protein